MIDTLTFDGEVLTFDSETLTFYTPSEPVPYVPPSAPTYRVDLCRGFVRIGEAAAATFEGIVRNATMGEWVLTAPLSGLEVEATRIGDVDSVIVWDGGPVPRILFAGLVRSVGDIEGGVTRQVDASGTVMEFRGVDLFGVLAQRIAFPDPATPPPWSLSHDVRTGPGSTVAAGYILANIGSGALPDRQVDGVTVVDPEIGMSSTWSARLSRLDLMVGRVCRDSGITVRVTMPAPGAFRFEFASPQDYSNRLLFTDQGDLVDLSRLVMPAASTCVIAAGQGELTARMFALADSGATGIDRVERVYDNTNITSLDGVATAAQSQLGQLAGGASVDGTIAASAAQRVRYLDDYNVGDILGVEVDSVRHSAQVEAVSFSLTPERQVVSPVLGRASTNFVLGLVRSVDDLSVRFDNQLS